MWLIVIAAALSCVNSQYVKTANYGVKGGSGGHGGHQYNPGYYNNNNNTQQQGSHGYNSVQNGPPLSQVGVCFIEVPTASLVRDPAHVPSGNGSRPDLSRIQTCCSGYIRNIYNPQICDPVCSNECINALCSAPDTCTCFPDHVKNAAGFCVATCPIGCQNGNCAGGECICKEGYVLDSEGRYCMPKCRDNCGGLGSCTAPNVCTCRAGYQSTADGSCSASCDTPCDNGDCIARNECRCKQGYSKDHQGKCVPRCVPDCGLNGRCISPNVCSNPAPSVPSYGSSNSPPYNQHYPGYPQSSNFNYSSQDPHSPDNLRPQNSQTNQPHYPGGSPYYPTDIHYHPGNNISSDSLVRPTNPNNQSPYGPGSNYPTNSVNKTCSEQNGQTHCSYPQYYPSAPNQSANPSGQNSSNPNQHPVNRPYYPYYPDSNTPQGPSNNPNQQGYYPGQQNQPSPYPGQGNQQSYPQSGSHYNPNIPNQSGNYPNGSQPHQPGHHPGSQPNQPSAYPGQGNQQGYPQYPQSGSSYNPNMPGQPGNQQNLTGSHPNQPGYYPSGQPNQPSAYPNQPYQPGNQQNQPGYYPYQPYQPGYHPNQPYQPYQPNQPGNPNSTNSYQPIYPSLQPNNPYPYDQSQGQIPQCLEPCINGVCIGNNQCNCNPGYVKDSTDASGTRCIPHCAGGCNNGVCSAPNFCICNMGYRKEMGVKGRSGCVKRIRRAIQA